MLFLASSKALANPPAGGEIFNSGQAQGKRYVVWSRDPANCRWQYHGTYASRRAADIAADNIKHAHPTWEVRIDEA